MLVNHPPQAKAHQKSSSTAVSEPAFPSGANELEELREVDIPAGDNGHDRARTRFARERSREAERTSSLGDDAGLLRHEPHGAFHLVQAHHDGALDDRLHALPHPRKHALAARAVHERGLPVRKHLRRALGERERGGRSGLRLGAPHFDLRAQRFHGTGHTSDQPATADRGNDRDGVRRILENLEAHRRVTGYEVLIVEWMDERPRDARIRTVIERLPGDRIWHEHELRAQRAHALELRGWRRLDCDDSARHTHGPRRVCDTLPRIAGADRPDAAPPLGIGQECNGVGSASQLVGVDRLQVLELEPHLRESRPELQVDQRCADDGSCDPLPGVPDLAQRDRADRFKRGRHPALWSRTSAAAATSSTATPTDLNSVISWSLRRPGSFPATTAPISVTSRRAAMTSPDSRSAASRESTNTRAVVTRSSSSSRQSGRVAPIALTCAPGASQRPCRMGVFALAATTTTSAPRTASAAVATAFTPCRWANAVAFRGLHTRTSLNDLTWRSAAR